MKQAKIRWLSLNGKSLEIPKNENTDHLPDGGIVQSRNGNQFRLIAIDSIFQLQPLSAKVDDDPYFLIGETSEAFSAALGKITKGSEKLALCRSIGLV